MGSGAGDSRTSRRMGSNASEWDDSSIGTRRILWVRADEEADGDEEERAAAAAGEEEELEAMAEEGMAEVVVAVVRPAWEDEDSAPALVTKLADEEGGWATMALLPFVAIGSKEVIVEAFATRGGVVSQSPSNLNDDGSCDEIEPPGLMWDKRRRKPAGSHRFR